MRISYKVDVGNGSLLEGTEILLTAINMLGRDPPFLNNQLGLVNGNCVAG